MNRVSTLAFHVYDKVTNNRHRLPPGLDFQDVNPPQGQAFNQAFKMAPYGRMADIDEPKSPSAVVAVYPRPLNLQRNKTERSRLPGIMQRGNKASSATVPAHATSSGLTARLQSLFNNEAGRRTFFAVWLLIHALVFSLGFLHYWLKGG